MIEGAVYLEVVAGVRYWEDTYINGEPDQYGAMMPYRKGADWCPIIRLADGKMMNWPLGRTADVHYKVCDEGEYWLLDEHKKRIAKWGGFYVPDNALCHGDTGHGDYIIFKVNKEGFIENYRQPDADDRWKKLP